MAGKELGWSSLRDDVTTHQIESRSRGVTVQGIDWWVLHLVWGQETQRVATVSYWQRGLTPSRPVPSSTSVCVVT